MYFTKHLKLGMLIVSLVGIHNCAIGQAGQKDNPVIFIEEFIGGALGDAGGLGIGFEINYQANRNLFTARYIGTVKLGVDIIDPLILLPFLNARSSMEEFALLYGKRFIEGGQAFSFSLGASYSRYEQYDYEKSDDYFSVPFEANIKWFKSERKRFKIYGLIPVGPSTGFGGSIGFKLFGNFSKHSYAGLGLTVGLGFHKVYD